MPAFISHALFGEEVQLRLHPVLQAVTERYPAEFYWGLQGPDLLFFRDAVGGKSPLPGLGSLLHREKAGELLRCICLYIRRREREGCPDGERLRSYFYGFLCHYALDSHCHPYIYYVEERRKVSTKLSAWGGIHDQIESELDTELWRKLRGEKISRYRIPADCLYPDERAIGRLYRQIFHSVYGMDVPAREVAACFGEARALMKLLVKGRLLPPARALEKWLLGKENGLSAHIRPSRVEGDVLNEGRGLWAALDAPDDSRSSSLLELMYDAEEAAVEAIALWENGLNGAPLPEWGECLGFDNGAVLG